MKVELKVGFLFIGSFALLIMFAWWMGLVNPFSRTHDLYVTYNFAGGIDVGSPVRLMGIKVGKVKSIEFDPNMKDSAGNEVKLKLKISIAKDAWDSIRDDSEYYINLAGVIGEKFLEITPGTTTQNILSPGAVVRGIDPPRIDQLISQGYGLAGKILDMVQKNEGTFVGVLEKADKLVTNVNKLTENLNKTLVLVDKAQSDPNAARFIKNAIRISDNLVVLSDGLTTKDALDTYRLLHKLAWRLEPLDAEQVRKFLQKEGIKAKVF